MIAWSQIWRPKWRAMVKSEVVRLYYVDNLLLFAELPCLTWSLPTSAEPKCHADAAAVLITWTSSSWKCYSSFEINLDRSRLLQESAARSIIMNLAIIRSRLTFNLKEQISGSLDLEPFSWLKKQGGSDFLELVSPRKAINPLGSFTWIYYPEPRYGVIEPPWTGRTFHLRGVCCLLFIFPNGLGSDQEKRWLWGRFTMVPFQTKGERFLPWTVQEKLEGNFEISLFKFIFLLYSWSPVEVPSTTHLQLQ